ncbi:peptide-methionine (S)-S-oxide reductase MsrA [Sulfurospirillum sp. 1307]|jgi:peptide methionine sulfoxide reductase msrA/msrB
MKKLLLLLALTVSMYAKTETIVFGAGCFWGVEKYFEQQEGVIDAKSGYAGGNYINPTYKTVLKYRNSTDKNIINYTETVEVIFDNQKTSAGKLIREFWELHNPTQGDRQGNDIGNNYRSAIFYTNETQKNIALKTKDEYQKLLTKAGFGKITTQIAPLTKFYEAEDYHQDYLQKNPFGYCPNHRIGVKFEKKMKKPAFITPLGGKEVVVIDAPYCPYCEKFAKDVTSSYKGDTPLRTANSDKLKDFKIKTQLTATPTILFIEDGKEVYSHVGYMDKKDFYRALGEFKLGTNSEAFNVAFNQGTDGRYCKQYEIFKNTPDGVFVDKLSGDILFDTKDRFNSGSGWLSFFKAVDGSTIEKKDTSYGMIRTEVIAKNSGVHLGHVFNDAPGGRQRFCINATVLNFIARNDIKK